MTIPRIGSERASHAGVCAVVVTYFPDASCAANLRALAPQVDTLIIVDNGSSDDALRPIRETAHALGASVLCFGCNLGIAAALNAGLAFARQSRCRWLATFDQDSRASPHMIECMLSTLQRCPDAGAVALIAACPRDPGLGISLAYPGAESVHAGWRIIPCAGTSGNLVDVEVASQVGGFDEAFFIDFVDFEFCFRLRRHGYRILEASTAVLIHSLGRLERRRFLHKEVLLTNHAPTRHYYMARNGLLLWRRYWRREYRWVSHLFWLFLRQTFYLVLYEPHASTKIRMMLAGLRDASSGVTGPYAGRAP